MLTRFDSALTQARHATAPLARGPQCKRATRNHAKPQLTEDGVRGQAASNVFCRHILTVVCLLVLRIVQLPAHKRASVSARLLNLEALIALALLNNVRQLGLRSRWWLVYSFSLQVCCLCVLPLTPVFQCYLRRWHPNAKL